MTIKADNVKGTGERTCKCGSWLAHWQKYTNINITPKCSVYTCQKPAEVGAHVIRPYGSSHFIVPLCQEHNKDPNQLNLGDGTQFVSANVSETCGK